MPHTPEHSDTLENYLFDEIPLGHSVSLVRTLTPVEMHWLALMAEEITPCATPHSSLTPRESTTTAPDNLARSTWCQTLISTLLGTHYPGPGTLLIEQSIRFIQPITPGERITLTLTVKEKFAHNKHILFTCLGHTQKDISIFEGQIEIQAPQTKIRTSNAFPLIASANWKTDRQQFFAQAQRLPPIRMAVVHPCDEVSLKGALAAATARLIVPILVGPEHKIRALATQHNLDLRNATIVSVEHSHAAAAMAVNLVRQGKVDALMKGSLHTDELMREIIAPHTGLRTDRRLSHVFVMEVPTYPKPLLITDAAINIAPSLEDKRDIVQNAIDLAQLLGYAQPKVAILSAVETINSKIPSTLDAAALCKMADRGQIKGGIVDGPLAFDNAISVLSANIKGITSAVAGHAEILVVPDLESGNILAKQLEYLGNALSAGIVLGARVPIVLTSRADAIDTRMASCALASLISEAKKTLAIK